jgi:hypothetical protein
MIAVLVPLFRQASIAGGVLGGLREADDADVMFESANERWSEPGTPPPRFPLNAAQLVGAF